MPFTDGYIPKNIEGSSLPDAKLNPLKNYWHHLKYLDEMLGNSFDRFQTLNTFSQRVTHVGQEWGARFSLFRPIVDRYDYADELLGVVMIPVTGALSGLVLLLRGLGYGSMALAYKAGLAKDEAKYDTNCKHMATYLLASATALLSVVVLTLKSILSLITRPLVTAVNKGYGQSEDIRFCAGNMKLA